MSDKPPKSNPVPVRFDDELTELIDRLNAATGISKTEIIRRSVRFALQRAQETGSINLLFGDEDAIKLALNSDAGADGAKDGGESEK